MGIETLTSEHIAYAETEKEQAVIKSYLDTRSSIKTARERNIPSNTVRRILKRILLRAAKAGYTVSEDKDGLAPEGYYVKGKSTYYGPDGKIKGQWVKTLKDKEQQAQEIRDFYEELAEPLRGTKLPKKNILLNEKDHISVYVIGDAHFGMYAWHEETLREDYDSDIAKRDHEEAIDYLVASAPASKTGVLVNVGDFLHSDNRKNVTPLSGNTLDVDGRFTRVRKIAAFTLIYMIDKMLEKHQEVIVINVPGNHDIESSGWLSIALDMMYEKEPRVKVDTSPSKHLFLEWENNLFCFTHGDTVKFNDLPSLMANFDNGKPWGRCENREAITGHVHHKREQDIGGIRARSFTALPPPDAWHAEKGYGDAKREMNLLVYHRDYGFSGSVVWNVRRNR